ncbi:MAG: peptidylprolyl isomerase [Brevinematales bacterium]|nr:peptidylprolyl isomerase [Brevinematales bacterium]
MANIAIVNGETISTEKFEKFLKRILFEFQEDENFELTKENKKFIKTEALHTLIERILILQEANKKNISINEKEVLEKLEEIKSSVDEEDLKEDLKKIGLSETELFEEIKNEEIMNKFFNEYGINNISFTEEELKNFYESNKEFIKEPDLLSLYEIYTENEAKADLLLNDLNNLNLIDEIEKKLKEENVDYFYHNEIPDYKLPPEVIEEFKENPEQKNIILRSEMGIFIYKIIEFKAGKRPEYSEIKRELAEFLVSEAIKETKEHIIQQLLDKAEIKYLDTSILEE